MLYVYAHLARREEQAVIDEFGDTYRNDRWCPTAKNPAFIPRYNITSDHGEPS